MAVRLRHNPHPRAMGLSRPLLAALVIGILAVGNALAAHAQSGAARGRAAFREYGVNLTFAVYQFDDTRSPGIEELTRLSSTFTTPAHEIAHIKDQYKLEDVALRHIRSVGLKKNEKFNDAVLLGPEYMVFTVSAVELIRGLLKLDFSATYANESILNTNQVEIENYETVLLRGGKGSFGVRYFISAGGQQDSVPIERTLLVSITPEIVPVSNLRDRPEELSRPVDEFGRPIALSVEDVYTPPIVIHRVVPQFQSTRPISGAVLLSGIVNLEGTIENVRVLRSIDPPLDQRAADAFRQFRFSPALLNGNPVRASYREEVSFGTPRSLSGPEEEPEEPRRPPQRRRRRFP